MCPTNLPQWNHSGLPYLDGCSLSVCVKPWIIDIQSTWSVESTSYWMLSPPHRVREDTPMTDGSLQDRQMNEWSSAWSSLSRRVWSKALIDQVKWGRTSLRLFLFKRKWLHKKKADFKIYKHDIICIMFTLNLQLFLIQSPCRTSKR